MNIKQEKGAAMSPETSQDQTLKTKKYCDRQFKIQLARALKANFGEADYFDRIKA